PTPEPESNGSSGSLAWLTLLAAPFAFMRRRKQK
ncbi:MAG: GlyGly-CTERM sorting domain-containing protein, partial [Pseudoalteromonas sp.]|nr:GlyGly-CTERM sorting domain-containing protein [Pseudoalteromonas sp.]